MNRPTPEIRLEDLTGGVQVTCFPRTYEESKELLVDNAVVVCRAKLEERLDADDHSMLGLLLEEVMDLEHALERFSGGLVVTLQPQDHGKVERLAKLVESHRGANRLFLEIEGGDGRRRRIRASERHGVRISARLASELEGLLGKGRTKLARV